MGLGHPLWSERPEKMTLDKKYQYVDDAKVYTFSVVFAAKEISKNLLDLWKKSKAIM